MNADYFLDTNVLVYAFDKQNTVKQARARELIAMSRQWVVSWQVVQEFCNVSLHRFAKPLSSTYLGNFLDTILLPRCTVFTSPAIIRAGLQIHEKTGYRIYDSLVVAAAIESGSPILYSEDLQHGRSFGTMEIKNPFL